MAYSDSFPAVRPVFQSDFANGGRIDPRITFSRSDTPPTYAAPSAVHYWSNEKHLSSENLVLQSSTYNTTWSELRLDLTGSQTDPSGGTGAWKLAQESGQTNAGEIYQYVNASAARHVLSFYAKAGTNRNFIQLTEALGNGTAKYSYINLSTGAAATVDPSHSFTVTAVGSAGWYRISVPLTPNLARSAYIKFKPIESDASVTVTDNQGFIYLWGVQLEQLDANGPTPINQTTTQVHREYAPTLKSVSTAGQPRFEYSPTDSASAAMGESLGLLVEGQSQNLIPYSSAINSWATVGDVTITDSAAVGPDGTLSASLVRPTTVNSYLHYVRETITTVASSSYTFSAYVKPAGYTKVQLFFYQTSSPYTSGADTSFTLTGSGSATTAVGSSTITAVGGGYYRISVTGVAGTTATFAAIRLLDDSGSNEFVGDGYSGILCTGVQYELGSHCSSLISTSGSQATRAADSASMVDANLFDTGSGAIICELGPVAGTVYPTAFALTDSSTQNIVRCQGNNGATQMSLVVNSDNSGVATITQSFTPTGTKLGVSYDTNSFKLCTDGGTVGSDTAGQVPEGLNRLEIGGDTYSSSSLSGHVKRIALYGEALSDTNLQAVTS